MTRLADIGRPITHDNIIRACAEKARNEMIFASTWTADDIAVNRAVESIIAQLSVLVASLTVEG